MLYYGCQDSGTIVFEIENSVIVVVLIFLKHRGLCGRLADSNFFYTEDSISCTDFRVRVTPFACTLFART